ncbi:MAG: type II toxin-antitoxin system RelE/ParE family toxin [Rhodospirillaceae bacterium]|nr:type II toxin-antitoxin system RelE/ParE family toxin [Rhodospirillales bacterium]
MSVPLFFNHHSVPAKDDETARALLLDTCRGIAVLVNRKRCLPTWLSHESVETTEFAKGYFFANFRTEVARGRDRDLFVLLSRISLRHPFRDNLPEEVREVFDRTDAQLREAPELGSVPVLAAAQISGGIAVGLASADVWDTSTLPIVLVGFDDNLNEDSRDPDAKVLNLSRFTHADDLERHFAAQDREYRLENWENVLPQWVLHHEFREWLAAAQPASVIHRVMHHADALQRLSFNVGRPTVDVLHGSKLNNLKELRVLVNGSNPLRIFFARRPDQKAVMLTAGFKGGNHTFYDTHIALAEKRYSDGTH